MKYLRMLLVQTKMNFIWYLMRDGEMIFWSLAMPVFFLFLFSFAFGFGNTRQASAFLVPGLIGAQVLSSGFWGIGVQLATFREKDMLRRVYLTPLPPAIFFASLVLYRLSLLAAQSIILTVVGILVFHIQITGDLLSVSAILLLGAGTFVALGTLVGVVAKTTESANNIASILTVPLAFLSDAYIPLERFPAAFSKPLYLLPSTQFVDTFRGVLTGGEPVAHFTSWIALLVVWTAAATLVSARFFRWI